MLLRTSCSWFKTCTIVRKLGSLWPRNPSHARQCQLFNGPPGVVKTIVKYWIKCLNMPHFNYVISEFILRLCNNRSILHHTTCPQTLSTLCKQCLKIVDSLHGLYWVSWIMVSGYLEVIFEFLSCSPVSLAVFETSHFYCPDCFFSIDIFAFSKKWQ